MTVAPHPFEVPVRPCTPWCDKGDGHGDQHPKDRSCWSTYSVVGLTSRRHQPAECVDGTWLLPSLNVYLRREYDLEEAHVVIHSEETDKELFLSRDEVVSLRDILGTLIEGM